MKAKQDRLEQNVESQWLTQTQLAAHIGISEPTLKSWRLAGCPAYHKGSRSAGRGARLLYDLAEVRQWMKSNKTAKEVAR